MGLSVEPSGITVLPGSGQDRSLGLSVEPSRITVLRGSGRSRTESRLGAKFEEFFYHSLSEPSCKHQQGLQRVSRNLQQAFGFTHPTVVRIWRSQDIHGVKMTRKSFGLKGIVTNVGFHRHWRSQDIHGVEMTRKKCGWRGIVANVVFHRQLAIRDRNQKIVGEDSKCYLQQIRYRFSSPPSTCLKVDEDSLIHNTGFLGRRHRYKTGIGHPIFIHALKACLRESQPQPLSLSPVKLVG